MARLLLVDDDISEISAVKRVLSRSGHAPLLATNGSDALASVGQARPDLIILGATCQDGEAVATLRLLDDDVATRGIPLVILGQAPGAPERAVQLPRPVDPAALAEQVKRLLSPAPAPPPFERRVSAPDLPASLDRRSRPNDPTLARKAAAEALLARARELRSRAPPDDPPARGQEPAAAEAAAGLDALFELAPPAGVGGAPALPGPTPPPLDLELTPPTAPATPHPAPDWERAHAEEIAARRALEDDLRRLRQQLEADRLKHDQELSTVLQRATASEQAALERQASALATVRDPTGPGPAVAPLAESPPPFFAAESPPPLFADVPPPDPAQQAARRRALSRRAPAEAAPGPASLLADVTWARSTLDEPPAELRGGHLDDLPMPRLLAVAWRARASGRLDVVGDGSRALWFEDGQVVGAASNVAGERVDEVALRLGLLTREQHRQVAGAATGLSSRRAAVLLVDRGYLKAAELTSLVRARTEEVAFGIFAETNARFRWVADRVPSDERIALDRPALALAVEGVRRRWLAPRLEPILGGPATLVIPVQGGPAAAELGLLPEEQRALASADGLRTLDEVLAGSPLDALSTRQLLSALVLVGALGVRVVQAGRPAQQVSAGIDLARVKEKLELVRRADYFTILGLGRVATPHEVRAAADRLLAEFQPERFQGLQEEGLPARLEEIRRVVTDAREVLADPFLREEYQQGLAS